MESEEKNWRESLDIEVQVNEKILNELKIKIYQKFLIIKPVVYGCGTTYFTNYFQLFWNLLFIKWKFSKILNLITIKIHIIKKKFLYHFYHSNSN